MCCGQNNQTSQSTTSLPSWLQTDLQTMVNKGISATNQPYIPYSGPRVAGLNSDQQAGFAQARQSTTDYQPYLNQANSYTQQSANPWSQAAFQQYGSPYQQDVIDSTMSEMQRQGQIQNQNLTGNAIAAGAFGGDRAAIEQTESNRNNMALMGQTLAGLNNQNWQQAQGAFNTDQNRLMGAGQQMAGLGSAAQQMGLSGANALLGIGGQQQQQVQQNYNTAYQDFQNQRDYPLQQAQALAGIIHGYPTQSDQTTTTTQPGPSTLGQVGSLGIAGVGLAGALGAFKARGGLAGYARGGNVGGFSNRRSRRGWETDYTQQGGNFTPHRWAPNYAGGGLASALRGYGSGGIIMRGGIPYIAAPLLPGWESPPEDALPNAPPTALETTNIVGQRPAVPSTMPPDTGSYMPPTGYATRTAPGNYQPTGIDSAQGPLAPAFQHAFGVMNSPGGGVHVTPDVMTNTAPPAFYGAPRPGDVAGPSGYGGPPAGAADTPDPGADGAWYNPKTMPDGVPGVWNRIGRAALSPFAYAVSGGDSRVFGGGGPPGPSPYEPGGGTDSTPPDGPQSYSGPMFGGNGTGDMSMLDAPQGPAPQQAPPRGGPRAGGPGIAAGAPAPVPQYDDSNTATGSPASYGRLAAGDPTKEATSAPAATSTVPKADEDFMTSPWYALMAAGLAGMGSGATTPLQAIGIGGAQGLQAYAQGRSALADRSMKQQQLDTEREKVITDQAYRKAQLTMQQRQLTQMEQLAPARAQMYRAMAGKANRWQPSAGRSGVMSPQMAFRYADEGARLEAQRLATVIDPQTYLPRVDPTLYQQYYNSGLQSRMQYFGLQQQAQQQQQMMDQQEQAGDWQLVREDQGLDAPTVGSFGGSSAYAGPQADQ